MRVCGQMSIGLVGSIQRRQDHALLAQFALFGGVVLARVDVGDLEADLLGALRVGVLDVEADLIAVEHGLGARVIQDQRGRQVGVQVGVDLAHDAELAHLFGERPQLFLEGQEVAVVEAAGGLHAAPTIASAARPTAA